MTSFRAMKELQRAAATRPPKIEFFVNPKTNKVVVRISHASIRGPLNPSGVAQLDLSPEVALNFEQGLAKARADLEAKRAELAPPPTA